MRNAFRSVPWRRLAAAIIALCAAPDIPAQTTSELTGTVIDSSGAAVPRVNLTVVNHETNATRELQTDDSGLYRLPFLQPGIYAITVQKSGFKPIRRTGVRLEVNQTARIDFTAELGTVSEAVEVIASAPLVESNTSSLGQVIETKLIQDLPLNGRNFVQLATLGPGVSGVGFGARGTIMNGMRPADLRPGSEIFSNGNREGANHFMMDGIDNNVRQNFAITLRPSVEAVREFKIQTNLFAAEQGRNPGATVNGDYEIRFERVAWQSVRVPAQLRVRCKRLLRGAGVAQAGIPSKSVRRQFWRANHSR